MTNSLRKPTRLTTRIEKATLVAIELLHPNLEHELAPISSRQLLDSVQHSMPNDQVTESELLIAMNKLHQKGHLAELQIQAAPEDGSLVFIVRGSGYAERSPRLQTIVAQEVHGLWAQVHHCVFDPGTGGARATAA